MFPTLARIALDVLPSQASSVPCEWLFSGTKQIADDCRSRLGSKLFKELAIMGSAWGPELYDFAAWNAAKVEEVMLDYELTRKHQENSIRLAWSGASGRSGMSGRFGCQKSSFSHFYQNFYITT